MAEVEDIDLGNGMMLRQFPEGSYTYPKVLPTEGDSDPFAAAAARMRRAVVHDRPVTPYEAPTNKPYIIEPDLVEAQQGHQELPTGYRLNDLNIPYNIQTGKEDLPVVQRPAVLPVAMTPNGSRWGMSKMLDLGSNIMGGIGAPAVATKAGEVVLGSGAVKTAQEAGQVATQTPKFKMTPVDYDPFATDWYHGSVRIDRMDPKIDPRRATSGPMPYFTDDPAMASSYAMGKKPDTSLQAVDAGDSVANYFKVSPKDLGRTRERTPYTVEQSWYALNPEQKKEILDKYHKIGYENRDMGEGPYTLHKEDYSGLSGKDHYEYILKKEAQNNPLKALRIIWHDSGSLINQESDLAEIYKLAGYPHKISEATAPWVEARGVMAAKLNMKNPLVTEKTDVIMNEILPKLEEAFKNDRTRKPAYSNTDMWDKNYRYTPKEWVAQAKEDYLKGNNSYVWTTIPDKVTAELKKLGFDGILDTGGKGGGQAHTVAIPFDIPGIATSKYSGKTLYSDTRNQVISKVGHDLEKGPFYSALEKAVEGAKVEKASADQWLGYLKNQPGVKSEEINTVLRDLPQGQITKEQLQGIVKDNGVKLKEITKGGKEIDPDTIFQQAKDHVEENYPQYNPGHPQYERLLDEKVSELEKAAQSSTRHHSYQLPGESSNYKETLLTLPYERQIKWEKTPEGHLTGGGYTIKHEPFQDQPAYITYYNNDGTRVSSNNSLKGAQNLIERSSRGVDASKAYKSSHWDEPNIIAHIRHNDRMVDGKKTLHLEEWQSDLHQAGRDRGYVGEKEKLQPEFDKIEKKLMDTNDEKLLGQPTVKGVLKEAVEKKIITQDEANTYKRYSDIENKTPVPDLPFKKNWEELALKKALHKAASEGYEGLSWTPGEAQALRYQNDVRTKLSSVDWHNKNMGKVDPEGNKQILVTPAHGSEIELTVDKHGEIIKGRPELKGKSLDSVLGKDIARQVLEKSEGNVDAKNYVMNSEGMKAAYDKRGVDILNNIAKKYGSKVEQRVIEGKGDILPEGGRVPPDRMHLLSDEQKASLKSTKQPIHYLPITEELRAKAKEGFPLFSQVPVTVPVDYDPFERKYDHHSHAKWRDEK